MMYFIHYLKTYSVTNKKGRELNEFISKYEDTLIYGEVSLDSLKQEIQTKMAELNAKYPKVREFIFRETQNQWSVKPAESLDNYVFILTYSKVRHTYRFSEQAGTPQILNLLDEKGGYHE